MERIHQFGVSADYPVDLLEIIVCNLGAEMISFYSLTTTTIKDSC